MHQVNPSFVGDDHSHHSLVISKQERTQRHKSRDQVEIGAISRPRLKRAGAWGWSNQFSLLERYHAAGIWSHTAALAGWRTVIYIRARISWRENPGIPRPLRGDVPEVETAQSIFELGRTSNSHSGFCMGIRWSHAPIRESAEQPSGADRLILRISSHDGSAGVSIFAPVRLIRAILPRASNCGGGGPRSVS